MYCKLYTKPTRNPTKEDFCGTSVKNLKSPTKTLKTLEWKKISFFLLTVCGSTNTHALESSVANIQSLAKAQEPFRPLS